jgi:hypothetical protein
VQPFFIMATRRSKTADTERLDATHIERVIELLANKGTKKDACAILGISYNTTRLGSIIDKYLEKKSSDAARRAEKRGKPASAAEISYTIQSYLEGESVDAISTSLYRGPTFINSILDSHNVPRRQSSHSYFRPELVPEEACREEFSINEKVYSMRYDSLARIDKEFSPGVYRIFLESEKWLQYAYQPSYELASLKHLTELGIKL